MIASAGGQSEPRESMSVRTEGQLIQLNDGTRARTPSRVCAHRNTRVRSEVTVDKQVAPQGDQKKAAGVGIAY